MQSLKSRTKLSVVVACIGYLALFYGIVCLFVFPKIATNHAASFDIAYNLAGEAICFVSAITLFISAQLDNLEKRVKILEEQNVQRKPDPI